MLIAFRMSYVRSITDHRSSITSLCVSNSSGDIASVSHLGNDILIITEMHL